MDASTPSTSASASLQFAVASTTGPTTTLETVHLASRRSRRTRSQSCAASHAKPPSSDSSSSRPRKRSALENNPSSTPTASRKRARTKAASLKKPPPPQEELKDQATKKPDPAISCCICMSDVEEEHLAGINGCNHRFCFGCIEKWAERENSCPLCKNRFTKIDRVNKKRKKGQKNTKKVKQRDQRSDLVPGAALEGLLGRLFEDSHFRRTGRTRDISELFNGTTASFASRNPSSVARLIFSGVGNIDFPGTSVPGFSVRSHAVFRPDDDSDDEESPFSTLFRAIHGTAMPMMPVVHPMSQVPTSPPAGISYASNSNDRTAGRGAENPLTIDDSDDEDVEVLPLPNPRGS